MPTLMRISLPVINDNSITAEGAQKSPRRSAGIESINKSPLVNEDVEAALILIHTRNAASENVAPLVNTDTEEESASSPGDGPDGALDRHVVGNETSSGERHKRHLERHEGEQRREPDKESSSPGAAYIMQTKKRSREVEVASSNIGRRCQKRIKKVAKHPRSLLRHAGSSSGNGNLKSVGCDENLKSSDESLAIDEDKVMETVDLRVRIKMEQGTGIRNEIIASVPSGFFSRDDVFHVKVKVIVAGALHAESDDGGDAVAYLTRTHKLSSEESVDATGSALDNICETAPLVINSPSRVLGRPAMTRATKESAIEESADDCSPAGEGEESSLDNVVIDYYDTSKKVVFRSTTLTFEERFKALMEFKQKFGHCDVSQARYCDYRALASWCAKARMSYKQIQNKEQPKIRLTVEEIRQLEEVGFKWSLPRISTFEERFRELMGFKKQFGHCNVPSTRSGPFASLGTWCDNLRKSYKMRHNGERGKVVLLEENIRRLEDAGFQWHFLLAMRTFDEWYVVLMKYKDDFGDCDVPQRLPGEYRSLGSWCNTLRTAFKNMQNGDTVVGKKITQEMIRRLNDAGFKWKLRKGRKFLKANVGFN